MENKMKHPSECARGMIALSYTGAKDYSASILQLKTGCTLIWNPASSISS